MGIQRHSTFFTAFFSACTLIIAFSAYASLSSNITLQSVLEQGIPVLAIDTEGGKKIKSRDEYLKATYLYFEAGSSSASLGGSCKIRGRGNTTWETRELYKKPYLLKLNEAASFSGFPASEKWVLMANTADKTQLRNSYATHLSKTAFSGGIWQSSCSFINLFVNGSYNGLYAITEKIEMTPGRIPLEEEKGSFLFEVNTRQDQDWNFRSKNGVPFSIRTSLTPEKRRFVAQQEKIQNAENILFGEGFTDGGRGWRTVLDEVSFADWYLLNELTKNHDAKFQSSCYMYYDSETEKIYMGPAWDFDISCGNISWDDCDKPEGFWVAKASWYERLFEDPKFVEFVQKRWTEERGKIEESLNWLDEQAEILEEEIMLNDAVWKNIGRRQWPHAPGWKSRKTHGDELNYMKDWLKKRIAWLDEELFKL